MVCDSLIFSPVLDPERHRVAGLDLLHHQTKLSDAFLDVLERIQLYKPFKLEPPKFLRIE
jgi:hypothetical protein